MQHHLAQPVPADRPERYGYNSSNTVVLTDDSNEASHRPTRANILRAMKWLVEGAARDDALFFH